MAADTERGAAWVTVNAKHNGVMVTLDALREQLAAQGLHVVTDTEASELTALRERVAKAVKTLEATKWIPNDPLHNWRTTLDGQNHERVLRALEALRGR